MKYGLFLIVLLPTHVLADVSQDFERGSGGLKAEWIDLAGQGLIFLAMVVLVLWVMQSSLKQLAKSNDGDGYSIFALIFRSVFLCVLVILTLT